MVSSLETDAEGIANLDLLNGKVTLQTDGLPDSGDVWFVDNQVGGHSLPDAADNMVRIGSLEALIEDTEQHAGELDDPDGGAFSQARHTRQGRCQDTAPRRWG